MTALRDESRAVIYRLHFVERQRLDAFAAALRLARSTVCRALVLDGGALRMPARSPYHSRSRNR
jgi:hypothetical protein